jgi:hypothetical protein
MRSLRRGALALGAAVVAMVIGSAGASAATPIPTVRGPLPVTASSHPFGGAEWQLRPQDLAEHGYVEEEYLVRGRANVYEWNADGEAVVRTPRAPYVTRMLVRRPIKRTRISGTVVVEPLNPSNLFDLNIGWALSGDHFMRNGDVWVGFTSKPVAVQALKTFDPQRYRSLSWANPLPLDDPRNCTDIQTIVDPPEVRSRSTEDGLVWDIFSQIGAWARSTAASNPLAYGRGDRRSTDVDRVYGFGYSQTGGLLATYINAIRPRVEAGGERIFDGYFVGVAGGAFVGAYPLNQCTPVPPLDDPRRSLRNAGVPVIQMMSQSDYLRGIASRGPDGDTPPDLYRHYEMAGAGHATPDELYYSARPQDIEQAGRAVPPMSCNEGPRSRFPSRIFVDAALQNIDLWSRDGLPAPPGRDIALDENGQPVVDEFGNVVGGLRSPYLDVPTSTWFGSATGASFCGIAGYEVPFDQATLDELYPTQGAYVRAVRRSVRELVADRYITRADGQALIREAEAFDVTGGAE